MVRAKVLTLRFEVIIMTGTALILPVLAAPLAAQQGHGRANELSVPTRTTGQSSALPQTQHDPTELAPPDSCRVSAPSPTREMEKTALARINQERAQRGLGMLVWNEQIADLAHQHSCRMIQRGFFTHDDPERGVVMQRLAGAGVLFSGGSENLYRERGYPDPDTHAVESWLRNPGHRKNMLDRDFDQAGIGIVMRRDGTYFVTAIFIIALAQSSSPTLHR